MYKRIISSSTFIRKNVGATSSKYLSTTTITATNNFIYRTPTNSYRNSFQNEYNNNSSNSNSMRRYQSTVKRQASPSPPSPSQSQTSTAILEEDEMIQMTAQGPVPVTNTLHIVDNTDTDRYPVFRVMDIHGKVMPSAPVPQIDEATARKMYTVMGRVQALDDVLYNAQRQGRISFYMQNAGEEAAHVGSASALHPDDVILVGMGDYFSSIRPSFT